jgi:hypothetical protein
MEPQEAFDFLDEPRGPPTTEPTRPGGVTSQGTSMCHYCGERMPSSRLESTPAVGDDQRWAMITPYHHCGCRWIESRGLRLDEGSTP